MKLQVVLFVLAVAVLSACRADRVDVRDLTPEHRALFTEAAAIEGVETTIHGRPGDWTVEYDFGLPVPAKTKSNKFDDNLPFKLFCKIRINPDRLQNCGTENSDHYFIIASRHELRHCDGEEHSSNPDSLMFEPAPCFPVD